MSASYEGLKLSSSAFLAAARSAFAFASSILPAFRSASISVFASAQTGASPLPVKGAPVTRARDCAMTPSYANRGGRTPSLAASLARSRSWPMARETSPILAM